MFVLSPRIPFRIPSVNNETLYIRTNKNSNLFPFRFSPLHAHHYNVFFQPAKQETGRRRSLSRRPRPCAGTVDAQDPVHADPERHFMQLMLPVRAASVPTRKKKMPSRGANAPRNGSASLRLFGFAAVPPRSRPCAAASPVLAARAVLADLHAQEGVD